LVRVLAARFSDRERASAALVALRSRLNAPAEDVDIAPLGIPGLADEGDQTLLAGRFHEHNVEFVRRTVALEGGSVVTEVDEQWTRPRTPPAPPVDPVPRGSRSGRLTARQEHQPVSR
jgi:hypothetical protein